MAPTPRRRKPAVTTRYAAAGGSSPATSNTSGIKEDPCAVCGTKKISEWIQRDGNYTKLMKFFWPIGIQIEVKPSETKNLNFCRKCYINVIELYDTNEVMRKLDKHLRKVQKNLVKESSIGLNSLQEKSPLLLPIHQKLFEKWGNGFKSEDDDDEDPENPTVKTYIKEKDEEHENEDSYVDDEEEHEVEK